MPTNIREQYDEYRRTVCEWCAVGCDGRFMRNGRHYAQLVNDEPFGGPDAPCTALPFDLWAQRRIERLEAALEPFAKRAHYYRNDPHKLVDGLLFTDAAIHAEHFVNASAALAEHDAH